MIQMRVDDVRLKRIFYVLGVLGCIVLGFAAIGLLKKPFESLFSLLSPFFLALILAYVISPVVSFLQKKLRLGRVAGTLLVFFLILLAFFLVMAVLIPVILTQMIALVETLREALPKFMQKISEHPYFNIDPDLVKTIEDRIKGIQIDYEAIAGSILPMVQMATSGGMSTVGQISMSVFRGIRSMIGFGAFLAFVAILNFYLILDWDRIGPFLRRAIPPKYRDRTFDILEKMDTAVGGFLRGQLMVSFLVGLMFGVGLFFSGLLGFPALTKFSILIGVAAGIAGFIPYLGPIIGVTPALLIVLLSGAPEWKTKLIGGLVVTGIFIIIQAIEGMVLQPRILGKGAGLHPLAIMLALAAGSGFGITGMIAAVPAACIIRVLLIEFYWRPLEQNA